LEHFFLSSGTQCIPLYVKFLINANIGSVWYYLFHVLVLEPFFFELSCGIYLIVRTVFWASLMDHGCFGGVSMWMGLVTVLGALSLPHYYCDLN
jgi:hypothetical protein